MKSKFLFLLLSFSSFHGLSQTISLRLIHALPPIINESSGVVTLGANSVWSHNDGTGLPELYECDTMGNLLRTLAITNANNIDWEEVCRDDSNIFYIGDFGNNLNDRTDLKILKLPNPQTIAGNNVNVQFINFSYPDQYVFPPHDSLKNFDMEAMFFLNDSLFLFSKNRTVPNNGYTKMYKLPATPGTYVAQLVDSFYTGVTPLVSFWITGAAISPDKSKMILISNTKGWLFSNYAGSDFFSGTVYGFSIAGSFTQKEGVSFIDNNKVYFTDEKFSSTGGNLYEYNFSTILGYNSEVNHKMNEFNVNPNPAGNQLKISFRFPFTRISALNILNSKGEKVFQLPEINATDNFSYELNIKPFLNGVYFVQLFTSKGYFLKRLTIVH
jgi:Secretion system C-terminal sorting domain